MTETVSASAWELQNTRNLPCCLGPSLNGHCPEFLRQWLLWLEKSSQERGEGFADGLGPNSRRRAKRDECNPYRLEKRMKNGATQDLPSIFLRASVPLGLALLSGGQPPCVSATQCVLCTGCFIHCPFSVPCALESVCSLPEVQADEEHV